MVADEESTVRYEAIRMGWYVVVVEIGSKDGVASTRPVAHAPAVRDVDGSIRLLDYYRTSAWRREGVPVAGAQKPTLSPVRTGHRAEIAHDPWVAGA